MHEYYSCKFMKEENTAQVTINPHNPRDAQDNQKQEEYFPHLRSKPTRKWDNW